MSQQCNGDWFMADRFLYYHCNGAVIPLRSGDKPEKCPDCGKPVPAEVKLIQPQSRTRLQVKLGEQWVNVRGD